MNVDDDILSSSVTLASRFILNLPITGLLLRLWGVEAVSPNHLKQVMKEEKPITLMPGGFEEATITTPS